MTRLSNDQIVTYTKRAMLPYECVTKFGPYEQKFNFAVVASNVTSRVEDISVESIRQSEDLERILVAQRTWLETAHGLKFDSWEGILAS